MLVPAISKKEELELLFAKHLYSQNCFYFNGYAHAHGFPDLTPKDNDYKWAIISPKDGKVVGYFAYYVDGVVDSVYNFGLYSFEYNPVVGYCVYNKMIELIKNHRRIEWRMIGGNPVERNYDKICNQFGGNKTVLHNVVKNPDGHYVNEYIYEIVKDV